MIEFAHEGRDRIRRITRIGFGVEPDRIDVDGALATAVFRVHLEPYQTKLLGVSVEPILGTEDDRAAPDFDHAVHELRRSYEEWERESTQIVTDNELFNQLLDRSLRDLRALYTAYGRGRRARRRDPLVRDHLRTGLADRLAPAAHGQHAAGARGARAPGRRAGHGGRTTGGTSSRARSCTRSAQGELARAGIIPHSPYYGSVDSTPWFVILYAQHLRWTGDVDVRPRSCCRPPRPRSEWIDRYGDLDGDGFVEYLCRSPRGIRNQGWKDSHDSIVHADGRLAEPPIALSEVQGYVYLAKTRMADVYRALGRPEDARSGWRTRPSG